MSFFVAYVTSEDGEPQDGDVVGSGRGWLGWADWAAEQDWPHMAHLAEEGWIEPVEAIEVLQAELQEALDAHADPNVLGVTRRLLEAVRARPKECLGLIVTDGTPPAEDEDE